MIKTVPITSRQAKLLFAAQQAADRAQHDLNVVAQAVLAGLDVEGQLVSVDTEHNTLNIEVQEA